MDEMYEKIEAYWKGDLKEPDLGDFIRKMNEDPVFNQEVMLFKEVNDGLSSEFKQASEEAALKNTLTGIGNFHFNTIKERPVKSRNRNLWLWTISSAAAIALLLFILKPTDLYDDYRAFPKANFTHKGDDPSNEFRQKFETYFNSKDYKKALEEFQNINIKENIEMQFYEGLCHLELNNLGDAETRFKSIANGNSAYKPDAQWYLGLTYLKQKNWQDCSLVLQEISTSNDHYQKAQKLLLKVKKKL